MGGPVVPLVSIRTATPGRSCDARASSAGRSTFGSAVRSAIETVVAAGGSPSIAEVARLADDQRQGRARPTSALSSVVAAGRIDHDDGRAAPQARRAGPRRARDGCGAGSRPAGRPIADEPSDPCRPDSPSCPHDTHCTSYSSAGASGFRRRTCVDAPTEPVRRSSNLRIRDARTCRQRLRRVRRCRSDCPAGCRSGPAPARPGRACPATPRSP